MNDELLVKYLLREASPEEVMEVESWMLQDAENRRYYESLEKIWSASRLLARQSSADEDLAWQRFLKKREEKEKPASTPSISFWRIAASFLIVAAISLIAYFVVNRINPTELALQTTDQILADTLSDGSVVTLNKNSVLNYPSRFTGNQRNVSLKGEAFFDIAPNKKKPFIIQVDSIQVTVVGTAFNIKSNEKGTEVIVEEGIVRVQTGNNEIELRAGESVFIDAEGSMEKEKVKGKLYNYYRSKEFVCEDTPLWKLVEVVNQAYNSKIQIGNPDLRNLRMNTSFNNESLEQVLNIISLTFDIKVRQTGDQIILE